MHTRQSTVFSAIVVLLLSVGQALAGEPVAAATNAAAREVRIKFADLGGDSIALHGVQSSASVNFGIRGDEVVVGASLNLHLTYSPSMLPDLSHLRVALNGQILLKSLGSGASQCSSMSLTPLTLPSGGLHDPSNSGDTDFLGSKPVVSAAPAVIDGVVQ